MTVKVSHLIGGLIFVALLGGAFTFGMKFGGGETQTAAASASETQIEAGEWDEATTSEESADLPTRETYAVMKVIDGDTIAISMNGKTETVRLIGIDTPETVDTRVAVQCFGKESSEKLKSLLTGKEVSIEIDAGEGERDKYRRMLAYVFSDGLHVNEYMVKEGYAYEYTYDSAYKYQKEFKAAEASAKAAGKGLWAPNACPKPEVKGAATTPKSVTVPKPASEPVPVVAPSEPSAATEQAKKAEPEPAQEPEPEESPPPATSGSYTCSSNKYNCSDFSTHAEAQSVFDQCGGADNDIHKLDNNKDGEACESLP